MSGHHTNNPASLRVVQYDQFIAISVTWSQFPSQLTSYNTTTYHDSAPQWGIGVTTNGRGKQTNVCQSTEGFSHNSLNGIWTCVKAIAEFNYKEIALLTELNPIPHLSHQINDMIGP